MNTAETPGGPIVPAPAYSAPKPSFREGVFAWLKIGLLSFGGPAGQIALMHRIVVDEKKWISEPRFLHALNFCMLLPGPEAQQLSVYLGWLLHGVRGGLAAGLLFVLPGAAVMMALSITYALYSTVPLITGVFWGIKAAVLAIVIEATLRIGRRALRHPLLKGVAGAAFVGIFVFSIPFPLIIAAAAVIGLLAARRWPEAFADASRDAIPGATFPDRTTPVEAVRSRSETLGMVASGLVIWAAPVMVLAASVPQTHVFVDIGLFFSKMAVVTFGGAYAVLSYVAQQAVDAYGWLAPGEMLSGLGLAETTPGPLIMVVQFVGFLGAFRHPGEMDALTAGILGGLLATWVTFAPCFLWIFLGAPYVERLRGNRPLRSALTAITAAVVGVILNLAVWFALHALFAHVDEVWMGPARLFRPELATADLPAIMIAAASMLAMLRFRVGLLPVLGAAALAGGVMSQL